MADEAVRQQRVSIQDASDFFAWTQQHQSVSSVSFTFVSKEACQTAKSEIERFGEITPVQGKMTVHAVAAISPGKIIARETSCDCKECFRNGIYNPESPYAVGKYTFSKSVRIQLLSLLQRIGLQQCTTENGMFAKF